MPARLLRGLLVGLTSGCGAYVAHAAAGGHASVAVGLVVVALALVAGVAAARRRIGFPTALALALAAQAVCHLLMVGSGGHHHAAPPSGAGTTGSSDVVDMLLAHLAVAVGTALLARGADRAVLAVLRSLVGWFLPRTWLARLPLTPTRFAHRGDARLLPSSYAVVAPRARRGPPVVARLLTP